ncbi:MAG: ArsR/SmtB family transcription factor [Alphaproteobacteria bacterium]
MIQAIDALSALAQRSRLEVFRLLVHRGPAGMPAGEIADAVGIPANTMSAHLAILTRAGLVTPRRSGRSVVYTVDFDGMKTLMTFLMEDCCQGRPELCGGVLQAATSGCAPARERRAR